MASPEFSKVVEGMKSAPNYIPSKEVHDDDDDKPSILVDWRSATAHSLNGPIRIDFSTTKDQDSSN